MIEAAIFPGEITVPEMGVKIDPPKPPPRRIGRFKISHDLIWQDWRNLLALFAQVVVVRAESRFLWNQIEYEGYSDLFDETPEGCCAPEYRIEFSKQENGVIAIKAVREDSFQ